MAEDYYKTLGVAHNASQADIQKAYRDLARKYHPDVNPGDQTAKKKFQQVQAAFDVLNDTQKREKYDRYGSAFETSAPGGPWGAGPGGGPYGQGFEDIDLGQFFGGQAGTGGGGGFADFFSQFRPQTASSRRPRGRRRRGANLRHELSIPFATAVNGGEVQLDVQRAEGKVTKIAVTIPAGIEDGKKMRIGEQGDPGQAGGPPGDILLTIRVSPHPCFQRQGENLIVKVPVTVPEAVLGSKVDVPTPSGTVSLRVPPGTSSGTKIRIKGRGIKPKDGPPGDILAEIQIVAPKQLDEASKEALRQLDQHYAGDPRAKLRW